MKPRGAYLKILLLFTQLSTLCLRLDAKTVQSATFELYGRSDRTSIYFNGTSIGTTDGNCYNYAPYTTDQCCNGNNEKKKNTPPCIFNIPSSLFAAKNVIAVEYNNKAHGPAHLQYILRIHFRDGASEEIGSSARLCLAFYDGHTDYPAGGKKPAGNKKPYSPPANDRSNRTWYEAGYETGEGWKPPCAYPPEKETVLAYSDGGPVDLIFGNCQGDNTTFNDVYAFRQTFSLDLTPEETSTLTPTFTPTCTNTAVPTPSFTKLPVFTAPPTATSLFTKTFTATATRPPSPTAVPLPLPKATAISTFTPPPLIEAPLLVLARTFVHSYKERGKSFFQYKINWETRGYLRQGFELFVPVPTSFEPFGFQEGSKYNADKNRIEWEKKGPLQAGSSGEFYYLLKRRSQSSSGQGETAPQAAASYKINDKVFSVNSN